MPHVWAFTGVGTGRFLVASAPAGRMEAFFREITKANAMPPQKTRRSKQRMTAGDLDQRLWRLRRRHDSIDASLRRSMSGWTLQLSRNGRVIFTQDFSNREEGAGVADARLQELRRAGWNEHW